MSFQQGDVTVTTIQNLTVGRKRRVGAICVAVVAASVGLAGCESGGSLFCGASAPQPETQLAKPQQPAATRVAMAPIIGAPDTVARQLRQDLASAAGQQRVTIVPSGEASDYTLRGYIVAAEDKANTKVSYIWDVTDAAGKRVNRITGEEIVAGGGNKDPWSVVTPQVTQGIAQKSATSLSSWLATAQPQQAAIAAAPAQQPGGMGVTAASPMNTASTPPSAAAKQPQQTAAPVQQTVSARGPELAAVVPSVTGAPGDGALSLTRAIQSELQKSGVSIAGQQAANAYRVEGVVKVGTARDGKQPIQIDWNVKDPQGKRVGTVSQKNDIAEGSLDGQWGRTADDAAAAAAQGILKLLPGRQSQG